MCPNYLASSSGKGWVFLTYPGDTGSLNDNRNKRGRHWSRDREHKMEWEGTFLAGLLKERVPRPLAHVKVWVQFQFATVNTRRDPENFRHPFAKPFADTLVKAGYLPDDTREFFEIADLTFSTVKLKVTPVQRKLGLKSCIHVAMLYRLPPDALEPQRAGGTRLQASSGDRQGGDGSTDRGDDA